MTTSDGTFTFRGTPLGKWQLYYEIPAKRNKWSKITTFEVTDPNVLDIGIVTLDSNDVIIKQ